MKARTWLPLAVLLTLSLGAYLPEATAAPTRINSCQTIAQSGPYEVTRDLTATGNCLVLAANLVTIDLAGFTITGNGTGTGVGGCGCIVNQKGAVVRNGMVTNFNRGVDLGNVLDAVIENVYAADNGEVGILGGTASVLRGNTSRGSGEVGTGALFGSIVSGNVVVGTVKGSANLGNGIVVTNGVTVSGNTSFANAGAGIFVTCPSNIIGNTAISNSDGNIVINPLTPTGCNLNNNVAP